MNVFRKNTLKREYSILQDAKLEDKLRLLELTGNPDLVLAAASHEAVEVRQLAAIHPLATDAVFDKLAEDPESDVRLLVATNENTPPEILYSLYQDQESVVREAAVSNLNADEQLLYAAMTGSDKNLQQIAAESDAATKRVLEVAIGSKIESIRCGAAGNENATESILLKAVQDPSVLVRKAAVMNDQATRAVIEIGLQDHNDQVRAFACLHDVVTDEMLDLVRKDTSSNVQNALARRVRLAELDASLNLHDPVDDMPRQIGGVDLTYAQRCRLSEGKNITLKGVTNHKGEVKNYVFYLDNHYHIVAKEVDKQKKTNKLSASRKHKGLGL